eukprot:scaffold47963_cov19-Tisochrysis_lutea.AAC.2
MRHCRCTAGAHTRSRRTLTHQRGTAGAGVGYSVQQVPGVLMAPLAFDDIMFYCEHIARALLAPNSLVVGKVIVSVMLVEPGMASPGYQHLAA